MRLYVVRHGQTNYNVAELCSDKPGLHVFLTEDGKKQVKKVAEELAHLEFDALYISDLYRTQQTAKIINAFQGLKPIVDARLDERKTGFDGQPITLYRQWIEADPFNIRPPNGESFQDIKRRVFDFLVELKSKKYERVLIVTHAQVMHLMVGYINHLNDEDMYTADLNEQIKNGGVVQLIL